MMLLLLVLLGFISHGSCQLRAGQKDPQRGTFLGHFETLEHEVGGAVWALDEEWLRVEDFTYDGRGPDAFFWVGTEGEQPSPQGFLVPFPSNGSGSREMVLPAFHGSDVLFRLPDKLKVSDLRWISVWCRRFTVNFGSLLVPRNIELPMKRKISELSRLAHGVRSGNVTLLDAKTLYIPNLHYDGSAPDAFFWVGKGKPDRTGHKIPNEKQSTAVLGHYDGVDIELVLPDNLTLYEIDYLSIWCVTYRHNFGHVMIPPASELYLPPALGQTQVKAASELQPIGSDKRNQYDVVDQVPDTESATTEAATQTGTETTAKIETEATRTAKTEAETETEIAKTETKAITETETKSDTEAKTETETEATRTETETEATRTETETEATRTETETEDTRTEIETDATRTETETEATRTETETEDTRTETKTKATRTEIKTDATRTETETETTRTETETEATRTETETEATRTETKTEATRTETEAAKTETKTATEVSFTESESKVTKTETETTISENGSFKGNETSENEVEKLKTSRLLDDDDDDDDDDELPTDPNLNYAKVNSNATFASNYSDIPPEDLSFLANPNLTVNEYTFKYDQDPEIHPVAFNALNRITEGLFQNEKGQYTCAVGDKNSVQHAVDSLNFGEDFDSDGLVKTHFQTHFGAYFFAKPNGTTEETTDEAPTSPKQGEEDGHETSEQVEDLIHPYHHHPKDIHKVKVAVSHEINGTRDADKDDNHTDDDKNSILDTAHLMSSSERVSVPGGIYTSLLAVIGLSILMWKI